MSVMSSISLSALSLPNISSIAPYAMSLSWCTNNDLISVSFIFSKSQLVVTAVLSPRDTPSEDISKLPLVINILTRFSNCCGVAFLKSKSTPSPPESMIPLVAIATNLFLIFSGWFCITLKAAGSSAKNFRIAYLTGKSFASTTALVYLYTSVSFCSSVAASRFHSDSLFCIFSLLSGNASDCK